MQKLQNLEVTAGNQVLLNCTTDTPAQTATCSIISHNLNIITELSSVLDVGGTDLVITLPPEITLAARSKGTLLQIAWDFGSGHIENTRVNLVGVS